MRQFPDGEERKEERKKQRKKESKGKEREMLLKNNFQTRLLILRSSLTMKTD